MQRGFALLLATALTMPLVCWRLARAGTVVGSKHDLSSTTTPEPCVFCHTPHYANTNIDAPLWNRTIGNVTFTPYQSSTMDTVCPSVPSGVSLACLGCHDGVNAGNDKHDLVNAPGPGGVPDTTSWPNCYNCHPDIYGDPAVTWIGLDLRDDHPISMTYPTPAQDPAFTTPPDSQKGWGGSTPGDIKLYAGKVECASCHNVHNPDIFPFLRKANANSALCLTCHVK